MPLLGEVMVLFMADTAGFTTGAGMVVAGLVGIGAAIGESVKSAGDFQTSMTRLVTSAGLAPASLNAVSSGILKMSADTGTGTDQLAKGMFNVESALHLGAGGLQVLQAAAQGAKAENSDLAQTTDVLTTAMVNYRLPASQAADVMNSLITTVAAGKMHMDDLTGSLKNVLPVAAAFHIKLGDVEGALSTMANAGDRGTSAGTHLAMMFKMLSSPVGAAKKEMAAMGLDSIKLAETLRTSVPGALKMIQDAVSQHFTPGSVEYNRAILAILGGSKSGVAGLEIMNQGLGILGQNTDAAAAALRKGSKDVENWSTIQGTFNFKMDSAKASMEVLGITLGTELLPLLGNLLDQVTPLVKNFLDWENKTHGVENAVKALATGIGNMISAGAGIVKFFQTNQVAAAALEGVLVVLAGVGIMLLINALVAMGAAAIMASIEFLPMIAAIALVALAVTGIILLIKNWGAIMDWLTGKTKQSQLQQQELNQKNALKTIQISEQQKRGVLANQEDERTQLIAKIKGMADGAAKSREQIRLSALNAQIATTQGDLKELDKEKTQHLATLKQLQAQDPQIREQTKIAAIAKQVDEKNGVLKTLDDEKTQLVAKILAEKDSSTKTRDLMKLDAINKQIDTTTGTIKALTDEKDQHKTKLNDMKTADLEARKNWYDRANDATTTWVNTQQAHLGEMVGGWISGLGTITHTVVSWIGTTTGNFMSGLGTITHIVVSWIGTTTGNFFSGLGGITHVVLSWIGTTAGNFASGLGGIANSAVQWGANIVQSIASGIQNSIGSVIQAAQNVASAIANFLPHSPAKEGPLSKLDEFGPALVHGIASGVDNSSHMLKSSMDHLFTPATGTGYSVNGTSGQGNGTQTIIIQMDGRDVAKALGPHLTNEIRLVAQVRR